MRLMRRKKPKNYLRARRLLATAAKLGKFLDTEVAAFGGTVIPSEHNARKLIQCSIRDLKKAAKACNTQDHKEAMEEQV